MRIVFWIGCMLASVVLGQWMGKAPADFVSVSDHDLEKFTLLGKRGVARSRTTALEHHPCLTATAEALPELLQAAQDRSISGLSPEVLLVAARWFQSDGEGLLVWLRKSGDPQPLKAIASRWLAKKNPAAAWESLDPKRHRWDKDLVDALALEDPARSFEVEDQAHRLVPIFESWAQKDFAAAVNAVKGARRWQQRYAVVGLAERQASELPFEEAFAWASSFEVMPEMAMSTVIDQLAKTDLESALRHLSEAGISEYHQMKITRLGLGRLSMEEAADLLGRYPTRLSSLFRSLEALPQDPVEAARLLVPLTKELDRMELPYSWRPQTEDIPGTLAFLANGTNNVAYGALLETSLRYWSADQHEMVKGYIRGIPDSTRQSKFAQEFGGRDLELVNLIDRELLGDDLNEALVHGRIREAIQSMTHIDPLRAEAAARTIEDTAWRGVAHKALFQGWAEHDEEAAMAWANSLTPSERQAAELSH